MHMHTHTHKATYLLLRVYDSLSVLFCELFPGLDLLLLLLEHALGDVSFCVCVYMCVYLCICV
jgi:hypothetical protein